MKKEKSSRTSSEIIGLLVMIVVFLIVDRFQNLSCWLGILLGVGLCFLIIIIIQFIRDDKKD